MSLSVEVKQGKFPVNVLSVSGRLDGSNYKELIEEARLLLMDSEYLLLDMADCNFLSSAGIYSLHSIALMAHQAAPIDPDNGWNAFHSMQKNPDQDLKSRFKIVNLQPKVAHTLSISGIANFLDIHTEKQMAIAAFGQ